MIEELLEQRHVLVSLVMEVAEGFTQGVRADVIQTDLACGVV